MRTCLLIFFTLLVTSVLWASYPTYFTVITTDSPAIYYRLDEASGDFSPIIGGGGCIASGGITYSQTGALLDGTGNTAVKFNGSTGMCQNAGIGVGDVVIPRTGLDQGWSLEVWFKPASLAADGTITSVSNSTRYMWSLDYNTSGFVGASFYGAGTSGLACQDAIHGGLITPKSVLVVNDYIHIVITSVGAGDITCGDGTPHCQGLKDAKLYINGLLVDDTTTFDFSNVEHSLCTQSAIPWNIAAFLFTPTIRFANGTVDELSFWTYALSAEQVLCHYDAGIGTPCGNQLDWPFTAFRENKYGSKNSSS